jgi:hypothetical protein
MTTMETRPGARLRLDIDSDDVAHGFAQLVLALAEVVRELLERQTLRRIDAGDLSDAQIERLGTTLLQLKDELDELRTAVVRPGPPTTERDDR